MMMLMQIDLLNKDEGTDQKANEEGTKTFDAHDRMMMMEMNRV